MCGFFSYDFASSIYLNVYKHNTNEASINIFSTSFASDWLLDFSTMISTTGFISGEVTAHPSGESEFIPGL
jgi:hypothetical protein